MPGREYIGQGPAPQREDGWNSDELHLHVRGRADATARVLIAATELRSRNLLPFTGPVAATGARWQDWRGTREQPRAHRFPFNPQVAGRDLPDFAPDTGLAVGLQQTLAETDYLPFHVNYADRLFEEYGGIEAARLAVEQVLSLQTPGQPADYTLVAAVWRQTAFPGYLRAWYTVEHSLQHRINRENAIGLLERIAGFRRNAPSDSIEIVQDVVYDACRSTLLTSLPSVLSPPGFEWYLHELV